MSYSQNDSQSSSSRGLLGPERQYFSSLAPSAYNSAANVTAEAANDPAGISYMPVVNQLMPMGKYGVAPSAEAGVRQLGADAFSKASGSRANRGFNTAWNLDSVVGDSLRMASPQLIPLAQQYAVQRAQMAPQLQQMRVGYALTPTQILSNLLAGSGESSASSFGFGFDASELAKAAAAAMSDRRLKSNVVKLGTHPLGIGWYEYDINGKREQGVMAQELLEVMPEAVTVMPNGYLGVYYDKIGRM